MPCPGRRVDPRGLEVFPQPIFRIIIKKRDLGSLSYYVVFCFVLSSSPSSSWGVCAGLPRPDLGWCPSVGVRVLLATSLSLLLLLLRPLLGVRVLAYHVLTWGGVPVSGCVCCWPRPFLFSFFFLFFFFLFFFFFSFFVVPPLLSLSSSWGACAGLPRPDLGWCPSVGVRVLLATSLSLLRLFSLLLLFLLPLLLLLVLCRVSPFVPLLFLGCVCWLTTSGPGVVSQCRGACVAGHVPFSSPSFFLFFFFLFFFFLFFFFFVVPPLLSLSSSWGACAGLPRPDLGWCPSVRVRVFLATSLSLLLLLLLRPLLGVRVLAYHVLTWGGVPVSGCVCCWPRPFLFSFFFLLLLLLPLPLPLLLLLILLLPSSSSLSCLPFCPSPLLGVRVLVYHVLTWGGVPVLGCV